jgi:hypothetical protein
MEDARLRAQHEPLWLSRNWVMAVIIGVIWIGSLAWLAALAIDTWGKWLQCSTFTDSARML